jgi:tRNA G18 (ribose-2'-O)-methylase SpoU
MSTRGFFAVGIEHSKNTLNVGTLWRSASIMGAAFLFTVGRRYKHQASDVLKSWRHIPVFHVATLDELDALIPYDCLLIGVEMVPNATPLQAFAHPERAVYLLGAEDHGLTKAALARCQRTVVLPGERSLNVAVAGSIVMYDRHARGTSGMARTA